MINDYKYGDDWSERGTKIKRPKIIVSPEVFVAQENILMANGDMVLKGTKFFSLDHALALVLEGKVPEGWRLPTHAESIKIAHQYNKGKIGLPSLHIGGYIKPNNMAWYSMAPCTNLTSVLQTDQYNYYWTEDLKNELYAWVITKTRHNILKTDDAIRIEFGLPVVLVKDI